MIIKKAHNNEARVVKEIVQNIDLYPTLLELLNIEQPRDVILHGKSLVPLLDHQKVNWDNVAYTCAVGNYGLVTDQYRFTKLEEGGYLLFDLKKDPHEWNNLASDKKYQKIIQEFEAKLDKVVWNKPN